MHCFRHLTSNHGLQDPEIARVDGMYVMMRSYRVLECQNILIPTYKTKARAKNLKLRKFPIFSTGSMVLKFKMIIHHQYYEENGEIKTSSLVFFPPKSLCRVLFNLSCRGTTLVRHMALPVHISSNNGLIDMIAVEKVFTDVLAMRFNT